MNFYLILFLSLSIYFNSVSQETSIKSLNMLSIEIDNKLEESFNLKRIKPIGLTNKSPNKFFNYNLDFDINAKNNDVDITSKSDLVIPTWKIRQKFSEGSSEKSKCFTELRNQIPYFFWSIIEISKGANSFLTSDS